jgi:hypothetical protein
MQPSSWRFAALVGAALGVLAPAEVLAQEANQVLVVPFSQRNTALPHPAHEGARITLKAIVRNAQCATYRVSWDVNRNGNYDDDWAFNAGRQGTSRNVEDAGRIFEVPNVERDSRYNINVRVRNTCDNNAATRDKFATYRLFVYDFRPSNNPNNWTTEQLEIMSAMAAQEAMWYIHRTKGCIGYSHTDARMEACDQYVHSTGLSMWLMVINGHLPAYRPGSYNAFGQPTPDGWVDQNTERYNASPYAETVMRYANYLSRRAGLRGLPGGEEGNDCGYLPNGNVRTCSRMAGTNDNRGSYGLNSANVYVMGITTGAIPTLLPALAGTRIQHGGVGGQTWEYYVQQLADQLGAQQIDGGCGKGGWLYGDFNGNGSCGHSDGSTTQWAYIGLESAEVIGESRSNQDPRYGIIVNNRHKYRIADNLVRNQRGDWGAGYRSSSGRGDFKLTGGAFVGARWLGLHTFNRGDGTRPWSHTDFTRDRLRLAYDRYISYTAREWRAVRSSGSHWQDSMWELGDYLCGNTNALYNAGRCGSTYAMYSHQKGYRTGTPELRQLGNHDWVREFNTYYVRAMDRS